MPENYRIEWDNAEKTVVLQSYFEQFTGADVYQMAARSADMLHSVDHTVHVIIIKNSARPLMTARELAKINKLVPENQGTVLIVGSTYEKLLKRMGNKIAPRAVQDAEIITSVEEARQFLIEHCGVVYP